MCMTHRKLFSIHMLWAAATCSASLVLAQLLLCLFSKALNLQAWMQSAHYAERYVASFLKKLVIILYKIWKKRLKLHIIYRLILSSYPPRMQAGVFAKAVHMLELDLLLKTRSENWKSSMVFNLLWESYPFLTPNTLPGAKTIGKRGITPNAQR